MPRLPSMPSHDADYRAIVGCVEPQGSGWSLERRHQLSEMRIDASTEIQGHLCCKSRDNSPNVQTAPGDLGQSEPEMTPGH